jgi:hypothetical protein
MNEQAPARKVVRLQVEYVRSETVEFDFPDVEGGMGESGWGPHAVGVMLRQMWTQAYGKRQSMSETVNFQRWQVVTICDPEHQGYEYEHAEWERVPPFEDVTRCVRCGVERGK